MTWTPEKLDTIPEVYRDFMMTLKPVLDSRDPRVVLRFTGIPFGQIYNGLTTRHDYEVEQVRELARNLEQAGFVQEDRLGFFTPTEAGEELIKAMAAEEEAGRARVPPFPKL